jgi:L-methionine (R)-S-oxide reductase
LLVAGCWLLIAGYLILPSCPPALLPSCPPALVLSPRFAHHGGHLLHGQNPTMFELSSTAPASKAALYANLLEQAGHLLAGETDRIANAANFSALLYHSLPEVNWVGFYFFDGKELVVGPFQGKPACVRIALGRGVCGAAAQTRTTQLVADVHAFPGHIACDAASRSEVVVPLVRGDTLLGVLDIDSPLPNRFDAEDQAGLEALAAIYLNVC